MLDLLDENAQVMGRVLRSAVHGNPLLRHRAVHILVMNSRGDLFLQKRAPTKLVQPGKWDSSCGGHIPAGESWEEGALRELEEELGLLLPDNSELKLSHEYWWESGFETERVRTYLVSSEGPFTVQASEISEGRFWTVKELQDAAGRGILTPNLEEELRKAAILK
jgi:isopentenyldiphosphate isomerase